MVMGSVKEALVDERDAIQRLEKSNDVILTSAILSVKALSDSPAPTAVVSQSLLSSARRKSLVAPDHVV
jgi:hypothetical protein